MSQVNKATKQIEEWKSELEAMTGSIDNPNFDPSKEEGPDNKRVLVGEFSCEKLQELISTRVKSVTDVIKDKTSSMSELMSTWAPILKVPTDPLKIIKWAIKVAIGPAALAIEMAIKTIKDMVQLIKALVGLVVAIANAAAKLAACLADAIANAINDVINEVLNSAAQLLSQAEAMVDQLMAQVLEDSGIQDAIDTFDGLKEDATGVVTDFVTIGQTAQNAQFNLRNSGRTIGRSFNRATSAGNGIRIPAGLPGGYP